MYEHEGHGCERPGSGSVGFFCSDAVEYCTDCDIPGRTRSIRANGIMSDALRARIV